MNRINWLASYPKSGNTWMRAFFTNLLRDAAVPAHINRLLVAGLASSRQALDSAIGFESADLTHEEVDLLRPQVYVHYAKQGTKPLFCKVHDAYTCAGDGRPLFPPEATAGAIYMIRNPLDVCVSYAHHDGVQNRDKYIDGMSDESFSIFGATDRIEGLQLRQRLLTWSDHVRSWVDASNLRVLVIRYEDMKARPVETFAAAAAFTGLSEDRARITRAVEFSSFDELQRQEREHGFVETVTPGASFFRKGKVGGWREELTDSQVSRIIRDHREVMQRFGYLSAVGEPVD